MSPGSAAAGLVLDRIRRAGPIGFDEFVDLALYAPGAGFYETGGAAGARGGDFLTSAELGPLFGAVVARAFDTWWRDLGEPDPFVVVEAGAGAGTLCRSVLDAAPACAPALRYVMVERSSALRDRQATSVAVDPPGDLFGPLRRRDEEDDDGRRVIPGNGPRVTSLADLPAGPLTGVVLANELLDNLAFALVQRRRGRWSEVRVGEAPGGSLEEVLVDAPATLASLAATLAPDAPTGARVPIQVAAGRWLADALRLLDRGRVVAFDYAVDHTAELAGRAPGGWLRTYRNGGPGGAPLDAPGGQDITCEVCVDQLARVRAPLLVRDQSEFLAEHGIAELVAAARAEWHARASRPDITALRARSRLGEAAALTDPAGLGSFRVLEWEVG